jgi:uncharacterized membrane protein
MKKETKHTIISTGLKSALLSFLLGTILLILLCNLHKSISLDIGFTYIIIATLVNLTILLAVIISVFANDDYQWKALLTIGIMLLNIPVLFLYLRIFLYGFQTNIN